MRGTEANDKKGRRRGLARPRYYQLSFAVRLVRRYGPEGLIVDVGCGEGALLSLLPGRQKIGVDVSEKALAAAKEEAADAFLIAGDMRSLPLRDGIADGVALIAVLGAVSAAEEEKVLREVYRVLREGGHVFVLVSQLGIYSPLTTERVLSRWRWRHFSGDYLIAMMERCGLKCVAVEYKGGPLSVGFDLMNHACGWLMRRWGKKWGLRSSWYLRVACTVVYNLAEGLEFWRMPRRLARYIYVVGRKQRWQRP